MKGFWICKSWWLVATALLLSSCAYYNTFFDARKQFADAEKDNRDRHAQTQTQAPGAGQTRTNAPTPTTVASPDKYRKVIETCSKLLEFYPKSRWVDDALMLMGISYYRLQDLPRAERKFTELMTIFPNSKYMVEASVWKARILADQKNFEPSASLLQETLPKIRGTAEKATALSLLGSVFYQQARWADAGDQFEACAALRQPRDQRVKALYQLGLSRQNQENYQPARNAFAVVAKESRDTLVAYDATVRWSKCEVALKNYEGAENILLNAESDDRFFAHADDLPLELAGLAIETGRMEDGIAIYQDYVAQHEKSERRGLAFYRLALVHRDRRADLVTSKAMLDSVAAAGASKEIADSARAAAGEITKGLLAFEAIHELQAAIDSLKLVMSQPKTSPQPLPHDTISAPHMQGKDSLQSAPAPMDTVHTMKPPQPSEAMPIDSAQHAVHDSTRLPGSRSEVMAQRADSILRAIARRDSVRNDSLKAKTGTLGGGTPPVAAVKHTTARDTLSLEAQLLEYRQLLQVAYLRAGEFYDQNLADPDSALRYYGLAASDTADQETYWKANLYLATSLPGADSILTPEMRQCYQNVLASRDVPIEAANTARRALGLSEIAVPVPVQDSLLLVAEQAWLTKAVSPDSALRLYGRVIQLDSTTVPAQTALFAQADMYENTLQKPDSAARVFETLMSRFPDSSWVRILRKRLKPPDSLSVFLKSDDELFGKKVSVESILQPVAPDSSGWPPTEESLRRIRYRQ